MNTENPREAPLPHLGGALTAAERLALRDLRDEIVEAAEDRVFRFGRVREAALEMRSRLGGPLDREEE
ncbi:hypothetical protein ACFQZ2_09880 [Streptomonospora algeriensis]|uniref:Uncharacterized protein n=1 Tax=Streptomonospora algeriensis TaxID=995084 RepID=A0ABW3BFT9_9ACTN